jgi:hypothetical protein
MEPTPTVTIQRDPMLLVVALFIAAFAICTALFGLVNTLAAVGALAILAASIAMVLAWRIEAFLCEWEA